ncbi:hypothetical protein GCM10025858_11720 [Alicyclobacillus sacchari]|uniref:HAMP domain-containing protein n=1 Tax=Alicyclobacillus sacchari TaxID=392010 RepID=UPI0023E982BD|nr:methyl-accepting chemotaxis protein [Alicyclobacillus sacchari]GMA56669.1 hypothetical protein GCM10025858_11720 [Alicyclobacillus sacchari]
MDNESVPGDQKRSGQWLVSFSLRTKIILIVVLSLLVSAPIANYLNRLVRRALPNTHYGVYINTAISIIVSALIITWLVQILAIRPLHGVMDVLRDIAAGNLTARSSHRSRDEIGQLAHEMNAMAENLNRLVSEVGSAAEQLAAAAEELAASAEQTGKASEQIAVTVQEVSAGVGRQEERIESSTDVFTAIAGALRTLPIGSAPFRSRLRRPPTWLQRAVHRFARRWSRWLRYSSRLRRWLTSCKGSANALPRLAPLST